MHPTILYFSIHSMHSSSYLRLHMIVSCVINARTHHLTAGQFIKEKTRLKAHTQTHTYTHSHVHNKHVQIMNIFILTQVNYNLLFFLFNRYQREHWDEKVQWDIGNRDRVITYQSCSVNSIPVRTRGEQNYSFQQVGAEAVMTLKRL